MPGGRGFARVGGDAFSEVNFGGSLDVFATPFVFQDGGTTSLSTPFTMRGQFFGHFRNDPSRLAFSIQLRGSGTMSLLDLVRFPPESPTDPAIFSTHRAIQVMTFEPAAAPVPEPGTLALIVVGAGTAVRALKRRGVKHQ